MTADDERFMRRALALAELGRGLTSPNPMVGALVVTPAGDIAGEGAHRRAGGPHAEIEALAAAGAGARGATLYLTLEPCAHQGRTPPCAPAIVAAGIRRVVAAIGDPNPRVAGRGFDSLRRAGLEVTSGVLADAAARQNRVFLTAMTTRRPHVTLKAAMTLDGKIAAPDDNTGWVTSEQARAEVQRQRHAHDAIWTGIGTVLADDPLLTDRTGLPRRRPLLRVVMDSRLKVPLTARMLQDVNDDLLVCCSASADPKKRTQLEQRGVRVCVAQTKGRPGLQAVLQELARREITSVLLEAGAKLNGAALDAGIVDKVFLYYAPKILGGTNALPLASGQGIRAMRDALAVRNIRHYQFGEDFAVEGYLRDVYRDH